MAATSRGPLTYVKAGPGSGKTRVVAEAFGHARFVRSYGDPRGVVAATFARSARRELASRVRHRWGSKTLSWPNKVCTLDEVHRHLVGHLAGAGLIDWPGGRLPNRPLDSWSADDGATRQVGNKNRYFVRLNARGEIAPFATKDKRLAPSPAFLNAESLMAALRTGKCTHTDVRNVLASIVGRDRHPALLDALRAYIKPWICQFIVDEAFDMNDLDVGVVEMIAASGVPVLIVGDPWQSLYEFRGSRPDLVTSIVVRRGWEQLRMPGEHRYQTQEMLQLATALFDGDWFTVQAGMNDDKFDVVLARDWAPLWKENRIAVLPTGMSSRLDRSRLATCCVLVQHQLLRAALNLSAQGFERACANLGLELSEAEASLPSVVATLRGGDKTTAGAWIVLRDAFQKSGRPWSEPGAIATSSMARMLELIHDDGGFLPGLTAHQAKGLEWDAVLLLDRSLAAGNGMENRLLISAEEHRSLYVALTRGRQRVRVLQPRSRPAYGVETAPVQQRIR